MYLAWKIGIKSQFLSLRSSNSSKNNNFMEKFFVEKLYRKISPKIYIETLEGSSSNGRI